MKKGHNNATNKTMLLNKHIKVEILSKFTSSNKTCRSD